MVNHRPDAVAQDVLSSEVRAKFTRESAVVIDGTPKRGGRRELAIGLVVLGTMRRSAVNETRAGSW